MGAYLIVYYWAPAAVSVSKKNQRAKTAAGAFHGYTLKTGIHSILVLVWYLIISPAQYLFPGHTLGSFAFVINLLFTYFHHFLLLLITKRPKFHVLLNFSS